MSERRRRIRLKDNLVLDFVWFKEVVATLKVVVVPHVSMSFPAEVEIHVRVKDSALKVFCEREGVV